MKNSILKLAVIIAILFMVPVIFSNCSKDNNIIAVPVTGNQQYFEDSVLEHDLVVSSATKDGTDITSQFSKYTFHFSRTSTFAGTIVIGNADIPLTASWTIDATYNNLAILISPSPAPFDFLNDAFIFTGRTAIDFTLGTLNKPNKTARFSRL